MKSRSLVLVSVGLLASLSLTSCTSVQHDAATVNGHHIKMSTFEGAMGDVQTLNSLATTTASLQLARRILSLEIWALRTQDELAAQGKPITDAARAAVKTQAEADASYTALPPKLQALELDIQATVVAAKDVPSVLIPASTTKVWVDPSLGMWDPNVVLQNNDGSTLSVGGVVAIGTPPAPVPDTSAATTAAPADSTPPTDSAPASSETTTATTTATAATTPATSS